MSPLAGVIWRWAGPIALVTLVAVSVALVVSRQLPLSPLDEYVYLDYLAKVPDQGFVRTGEEVGAFARSVLECRGVAGYGPYGDGCGPSGLDNDALFPYGGRTGADIYSPLMFWITWVLAQPFVFFGVGLLDAGRLVGIVWGGVTVLAVYAAMRALAVPRALAVGAAAMLFATPIAFWSFAFISTDAAAIAFGAIITCVGVFVLRGRASAWWLLPLGIAGVLAKVQTIAALGVVVVALLIRALWVKQRRDGMGRGRALIAPFVVSAAAVGAQLVWSRIRAAETIATDSSLGIGSTDLPVRSLIGTLDSVLLAIGRVDAASSTSQDIVTMIFAIVAPIGIGVAILGLVRPDELDVARPLAVGALCIGVVLAPLLTLATYVMIGLYIEPPVRYGATLLPTFTVLAALPFSRFHRVAPLVAAAGILTALICWM